MNKDEWIKKLEEEGMENIAVVTNDANVVKGEHIHDIHTVHVILEGQLTIEDKEGKHVYKEGDRVDFPAGTIHTAIFGPEGCTMIVGVKK